MKQKKFTPPIFLLSLIAFISFALFSCSSDDYEEATLSASTESVDFTNAGGDQTVTINTNRDKWVASSSLESSWLTLAQDGNTLTVTADKNTEGADRKGIILINAGDATLKLNVTQSAGDAVIVLTEETAEFDFAGGEKVIGVKSNKAFTVDEDDAATDWLLVTYNSDFGFIKLSAKPYNGKEPRTGKFYIAAGTSTKEFTVTQTGTELVVLPLLDKETSFRTVNAYEAKRGSVVLQYPDGLFSNVYYFGTPNSDFPQIGYAYTDPSQGYTQAATATTNTELLPEIEKALEAKGFKKSGATYTSPDIPYSVVVTKETDGITIVATYTPVQDKAYPTFAKVPLTETQMTWTGNIDLEIHGKKYDDVKAWEASKGSTLDETISSIQLPATDPDAGGFAWYETSNDDRAKNLIVRAYWFNVDKGEDAIPSTSPYLNELDAARELYDKTELAFWTDNQGTTHVTDEFTKLLADAKFIYVTTTSSGYQFYARANGTYMDVLGFKIVNFSDYGDGTPLLDFQTYKDENSVGSVASILASKGKNGAFAKFVKSANEHFKKGLRK